MENYTVRVFSGCIVFCKREFKRRIICTGAVMLFSHSFLCDILVVTSVFISLAGNAFERYPIADAEENKREECTNMCERVRENLRADEWFRRWLHNHNNEYYGC